MLLQAVFLGLATGSALGGSDGAAFGIACASQQTGQAGGDTGGPETNHQHGLCCILHDGALAAPIFRHVSSVVLAFSETEPLPPPRYSIDFLRSTPELAPLSPRAPPSITA